MVRNVLAARASPRIPLESLQRFLDSVAGLRGGEGKKERGGGRNRRWWRGRVVKGHERVKWRVIIIIIIIIQWLQMWQKS